MPDAVTIVDSPPPAPPPAPTTSIQASNLPPPAAPAAPPKPGSARDRMFKDLQAKAKPAFGTEPNAEPAPAAPPAAAPRPGETPTPGPEEGAAGEPGSQPAAAPSSTPPAGEKKSSPWKMVDEWKARATKAEAELLEAKKGSLPAQERQAMEQKIQQAEARLQELEREIKYVDYTKSQEFQDKYQAPYEAAWKRATAELSEIPVTDPSNGESRPASPNDLLTLVNLPLGQARELANQVFGDFADDVMQHRKEIRALFDQQSTALEEAKKNAADRSRTKTEQLTTEQKEVKEAITRDWETANAAIRSHEKYGTFFNPVEGDENINQRLAKGFELVDRALAENPLNPKLTPEERASIVKRHAAVRNRAAAFGRVVYQYNQIQAKMAALEKELAQYKGSEPGASRPGAATNPPASGSSARSSIFADLRKLAK